MIYRVSVLKQPKKRSLPLLLFHLTGSDYPRSQFFSTLRFTISPIQMHHTTWGGQKKKCDANIMAGGRVPTWKRAVTRLEDHIVKERAPCNYDDSCYLNLSRRRFLQTHLWNFLQGFYFPWKKNQSSRSSISCVSACTFNYFFPKDHWLDT